MSGIAPPPSTAGTSPTDRLAAYNYKKRPYAAACVACKARKIRCVDAENPPCKACRTSRIPCEFPQSTRRKRPAPAPSSLYGDADGSSSAHPHHHHHSQQPQSSGSGSSSLLHRGGAASTSFSSSLSLEARVHRIETYLNLPATDDEKPLQSATAPSSHKEDGMEPPRFKLSGEDLNEYHGETSMYDDGRDGGGATGPSPGTQHNRTSLEGWSAAEMRGLRAARHKFVSPEEGESLIEAYFMWTSVSTGIVNRTVFLRDMATGGPYFSNLLLICIYISGLRFSPKISIEERTIRSEKFMAIIMTMIADELSKPSSVATAQALLSLAGTRCALGDHTQAWMFTGMGIRMIQDLGIHLAIAQPRLDAALDQETRDMRVRLYWSAYCWDKSISLGMGREPALLNRPDSIPEVNMHDSDDDWDWHPYIPGGGPTTGLIARYPRTRSLISHVLRHSVNMYMILESILVNMYSPHRPHARSVSFIQETDDRLKTWRSGLPRALILERGRLPEFCPPTNIVVINLLYHVMRILLYRPLLTVRNQPSVVTTSSFDVCRSSAIEIHAVLSLWARTFGQINYVYLLLYTTFVAAGVDLILVRINEGPTQDEALKRVALALEVLEKSSAQGPGIRRAIGTITDEFQAAMARKGIDRDLLFAKDNQHHHHRSRGADRDHDRHAPPTGRPTDRMQRVTESSMRHDTPTSTIPLELAFAPRPSPASSASGGLGPTMPAFFEYHTSPADLLPLFDDPQALADLLGDSNVGTDDPFAFLSADGWEGVGL